MMGTPLIMIGVAEDNKREGAQDRIEQTLKAAFEDNSRTVTMDEYPNRRDAETRVPTIFTLKFDKDARGCTHITAHRAATLDLGGNPITLDPEVAVNKEKHELSTVVCTPS